MLTEEQLQTTELLAVSAEDREKQQMMIDRISAEDGIVPTFSLLSDPDHAVIDRYGIFNPMSRLDRPLPHPTTLVVDMEGIVRWKFVEIDYKIRPENEDILNALAALGTDPAK